MYSYEKTGTQSLAVQNFGNPLRGVVPTKLCQNICLLNIPFYQKKKKKKNWHRRLSRLKN